MSSGPVVPPVGVPQAASDLTLGNLAARVAILEAVAFPPFPNPVYVPWTPELYLVSSGSGIVQPTLAVAEGWILYPDDPLAYSPVSGFFTIAFGDPGTNGLAGWGYYELRGWPAEVPNGVINEVGVPVVGYGFTAPNGALSVGNLYPFILTPNGSGDLLFYTFDWGTTSDPRIGPMYPEPYVACPPGDQSAFYGTFSFPAAAP